MTDCPGGWFTGRIAALARAAAAALLLSTAPAWAVCGDAILDAGEACDDGNLTGGDCCDASCQAELAAPCADEGNPCTDDLCGTAGTCEHTARSGPCDDGDACTADDVCRFGVCGGGTPDAAACLDHYMCHSAVSTTAFAATVLGLEDQLGAGTAGVLRPAALCAPASTNGGGTLDALIHEESYTIRPDVLRRGLVDMAGEEGTLRLTTYRATRLLVPTTKGLGAPPAAPPAAGVADHYACYRVRLEGRLPRGVQATVSDQFETRLYGLGRLRRLCMPVDKENEGLRNRRAHLLCYQARPAAGEPPSEPIVGQIFTDNQLGPGRLDTGRTRELCVPALRSACAVPKCRELIDGQRPNCDYDVVVADPTYPFCAGPQILVDRTHQNFHNVTPESATFPGRYWAFARLLSRDGYEIADSDEPLTTLLPATGARILVIANPETGTPNPADEAIPAADVTAIVDWVAGGGSLFLIIDHPPRERAGALLAALGVVRLFEGSAPRHTFTRSGGDLIGSALVANGPDPGLTAVDEVLTIGGTAFSLSPTPPAGASYEPVLVFPAGVQGRTGGTPIDLGGYLQGVAIRFGAGRVYVSGEAGAFTAQHAGPSGLRVGPDNPRFLRNIVHWLAQE